MSLAMLARQMHEAGTPMEGILLALEAVEARDNEAAARRAKEAVRSARYRERGGGNIPDDLRAAVYARDSYTCQDCGAQDNLSCDHVIPVSKGGPTSFDNLETLCVPCNSRKKDRVRKRVRRMSADIDGHDADIPETPPAFDKETSPRPPKEIKSTPRVGCALARKASGFGPPEKVEAPLWNEFCAQRKKPLSQTSYTMIVNTLTEAEQVGWPPGELVSRSIASGWETVFIPKDNRNGTAQPPIRPGNLRGSRPDPALDLYLAGEAELRANGTGGGEEAHWGTWNALQAIGSS